MTNNIYKISFLMGTMCSLNTVVASNDTTNAIFPNNNNPNTVVGSYLDQVTPNAPDKQQTSQDCNEKKEDEIKDVNVGSVDKTNGGSVELVNKTASVPDNTKTIIVKNSAFGIQSNNKKNSSFEDSINKRENYIDKSLVKKSAVNVSKTTECQNNQPNNAQMNSVPEFNQEQLSPTQQMLSNQTQNFDPYNSQLCNSSNYCTIQFNSQLQNFNPYNFQLCNSSNYIPSPYNRGAIDFINRNCNNGSFNHMININKLYGLNNFQIVNNVQMFNQINLYNYPYENSNLSTDARVDYPYYQNSINQLCQEDEQHKNAELCEILPLYLEKYADLLKRIPRDKRLCDDNTKLNQYFKDFFNNCINAIVNIYAEETVSPSNSNSSGDFNEAIVKDIKNFSQQIIDMTVTCIKKYTVSNRVKAVWNAFVYTYIDTLRQIEILKQYTSKQLKSALREVFHKKVLEKYMETASYITRYIEDLKAGWKYNKERYGVNRSSHFDKINTRLLKEDNGSTKTSRFHGFLSDCLSMSDKTLKWVKFCEITKDATGNKITAENYEGVEGVTTRLLTTLIMCEKVLKKSGIKLYWKEINTKDVRDCLTNTDVDNSSKISSCFEKQELDNFHNLEKLLQNADLRIICSEQHGNLTDNMHFGKNSHNLFYKKCKKRFTRKPMKSTNRYRYPKTLTKTINSES